MSGSGGGSGESETYLEAFVDQLSSLPHDLRRSLELLKSLDGNADLTRLAHLHRTYIHEHVEKRIVESLQVVELPPRDADADNDHDDYFTSEDDADYDESSPRVGVILRSVPANDDDVDSTGKKKQQPEQQPKRPFRPTTQELFTFTYESQMYEEIMALQLLCRQKADEKCAVAQQAYEMVDRQIQKLDADMAAMEPFLKVNNSNIHTSHRRFVFARPNVLYFDSLAIPSIFNAWTFFGFSRPRATCSSSRRVFPTAAVRHYSPPRQRLQPRSDRTIPFTACSN
jgi:hypothetical protein